MDQSIKIYSLTLWKKRILSLFKKEYICRGCCSFHFYVKNDIFLYMSFFYLFLCLCLCLCLCFYVFYLFLCFYVFYLFLFLFFYLCFWTKLTRKYFKKKLLLREEQQQKPLQSDGTCTAASWSKSAPRPSWPGAKTSA